MSSTRLRPRYRITSSLSPQEVLDKIQMKLNTGEFPVNGQTVQDHAFIRIPEKDQHYWSPELHVWVREQDGETIIYGVMGPKPRIWTMFMFFYTAILTIWFFGSSYGIIQLWLGIKAPFLWSIPLGLIGVGLVFGAAKYGRYKGKNQMEVLRRFLDEAVKNY